MADPLKPDLCIIGGSPAAIDAAEAARRLEASVVLVVDGPLGVAGPASPLPAAFLAAAGKRAAAINNAELFGLEVSSPSLDFPRFRDTLEQVALAAAPQDSPERLRAIGVQVITAPGSFTDPRTFVAATDTIRARRFILGPAMRPVMPTIPGLDSAAVMTLPDLLAREQLPASVLVLAGSPDALAIGQALGRLGVVVTVFTPGPALPFLDPEMADLALRRLQDEGVTLHQSRKLLSLNRGGSGGVTARYEGDTGEATAEAEGVLVVGTLRPDVAGLGLDRAKVALDPADPNRLKQRRGGWTSNNRIFAVGDGEAVYDHTVRQQALQAVEQALLGQARRPAPMPVVIATDPGVAQVGLTEAQVRTKLKERYLALRSSFAENDRARAELDTLGAVKVVATPAGQILGATVVGPEAAELAALFATAIAARLTLSAASRAIVPHPSFAAVLQDLALQFSGAIRPNPWLARRVALTRWRP